ncbi:MAG: GMC family oxidoreductase [Candidatus Obscuribacterales bacterium]|nr:GMC family oxidoreductase [Candidatus Obscuribacterales bacterium]
MVQNLKDAVAGLPFDVIVIGSGYGGAVSAYRLAQAGFSVLVLEKGYSHQAPNIPRGKQSEWNPGENRFGPHTVTHLSNRVTAWTGTALGGGSIVNAAVMIRKDHFENWPGGITRESLDPYYDRAEKMLGAKVYPVHSTDTPYGMTTKTVAMLRAAEKLGTRSVMPPVAITYREPGEPVGTVKLNAFGVQQQGCRQCGECSLPGCNFTAKNSLDFNYLYGAQQHGAQLVVGAQVDVITPIYGADKQEAGYTVQATDPKSGETRTFEARFVVLAAGSVGSSEILLRNKKIHETLPLLSAHLGRQYTTNGTFIGFAVRSKQAFDPAGGPEITAGLDFPGADGRSQGHLVFDGSFNGFNYDTFYVTGQLVRMKDFMIKAVSRAFKLAERLRLVVPRTTLPLLVIGRDNAVGNFTLNEQGRIQTDLNPDDNASFYKRANAHMRRFAKEMGTRFLPFPLWALQRKIDVPHNLGGVPMGTSWLDGVVDDKGRVFGHRNLLVLDGSIIPATMGANPALTIAALAERSMETVIPFMRQHGYSEAVATPPLAVPPERDLTGDFHTIHKMVKEKGPARADSPASLAGDGKVRKFIWTPGIFASHMGNHSKHILERVAAMGLQAVPVPVDTDVATLENIELIKGCIRDCREGEAILAGHSRGGIMNLDAYRQLSEEDKAKVSKIILVQSPLDGAPVADWAAGSRLLRKLTAIATRVVFGKNALETVLELTTSARRRINRSLPQLTAGDRAKIVTLRSIIDKGESPSFEVPRKIGAKMGYITDGLTPYSSSAVAGAMNVTLTSFDHENLVVQEPKWFKKLTGYRPNKNFHAGDVTEALLILAMKHDR